MTVVQPLKRTRLLARALLLVFVGLATLSVPALALGEGPGWELSAASYPANLARGVDQVDEVVPTPGEAFFTLSFQGNETAAIGFGAPASEVQSALEGLPSIGAGNVLVSESGGAGGYRVTFVGALGSTQLPELEASGASVTVSVEGAASGTIGIDVFNVGAAANSGTVTVTDTLPLGVKAKDAGVLHTISRGLLTEEGWGIDPKILHTWWKCTGNGPGGYPYVAGATVVTCVNDPASFPIIQGGGGVPLPRGESPQPPIGITVEAAPALAPATNRVSISGGGAPVPASTENMLTNTEPGRSGLSRWDAWFSNADGTLDTQAGSHPYEMTTVFDLATATDSNGSGYLPGSEARELEVQLPPGFIGNTRNLPQCTRAELVTGQAGECPASSEIGTLEAQTFVLPAIHGVFNMVPPPGQVAEFGTTLDGIPVFINFSVRSGGDYGITVHVKNIPQRVAFSSVLTIWGVPGEHSHDRWRGRPGGCSQEELEKSPVEGTYCTRPQRPVLLPLLTLPTSCGLPQSFLIQELSGWQDPSARSELSSVSHDSSGKPVGFTGCEDLAFGPSLTLTPDTAMADTPAGLTADVTSPPGGLEAPGALSNADIKDTSVALPAGFAINPGQAAGLQACSPAAAALEPLPGGEENDGPASCPAASKLGTVKARSPLVEGAGEKELEGDIYLLQSNPPHVRLLAALSADGVNVKLPLDVELDEQTGQITTRVLNAPQVPVSDFKLTFDGGARAAIDTATQCGTYTARADLTPWSTPFGSDILDNASFNISEGPNASACPAGALPFAPSFTAGSTRTEAGAFTSFSTLLQRGDGQQRVERLQFTSPPGLSAIIAGVPRCDEADANAGGCPAASQIGHAVVTAGAGGSPLTLPQPGGPQIPIYLTGPYHGAPFGLSIMTPAVAGPFDLGTIVTRARIDVDPRTAQVTVTTDPLPQIIAGVPTDLRSIYAVIDRPGFFFNPTSCNALQFTGTATSTGGAATATLSSPFTAGACRALGFTPKFTVSTQAKTSKKNGASLDVKLTYPKDSQANIHSVAVTLPKQLPSRLTTIQQACPQATFNANPASCPTGSNIGTAIAHTPVLASPVTGPAYLVSHGGAAFPDLVLVLQGEGVTLDLTGSINIKKGVTSSTFASVPDQPIRSFELKLPEGPHSGLAAVLPAKTKGNLCGTSLTMPTTLTGQNGAQIKQNTKIAVTGCAKVKKKPKAKKRKHGKKK